MKRKKNFLFGRNLVNGSAGGAVIIAEAGINHDGHFDKARKLIDAAAAARCTCVKFQTFKTEKHMSVHSIASSYITEGSRKGESFFQLAKRLELGYAEQRELFKYANSIGLPWISSFFDEDSLDFLVELGVPVLKIASGEMTNAPLLRKAAKTKIPLILSTGMAKLAEIAEAYSLLKSEGAREIFLMHCVSWYPASIDDMNVNFIDTLLRKFKVPVGLSDHTLGISVALGARGKGVKFFEKHFTLSKKDFGPDHSASVEPDELKLLVSGIDEVGRSLGSGVKKITEQENVQRKVHRKSVIAKVKIKKGSVISQKMLEIKRPGYGIPPKQLDDLLGYRALRDIEQDEVIEWKMLTKG
ncbi:MAG: N-acetylneuraminate synthase family protein [Candidatus Omnitrophota bacterium]